MTKRRASSAKGAKLYASQKTQQHRRKKTAGRRQSHWIRRLIFAGVYWSAVASVWLFIAGGLVVGYHALQLPRTQVWAIPDRPPNVKIVSVDGALIANRGVTGGSRLSLSEMSAYIPLAVTAIEDRRFQYHFGVDPLGLARAMYTNFSSGRLVQGGSTITQQLAKNLFLAPERTLGRKIQEAILAVWLESRFSKDEILELYLNRIYFGSGAWGVDAAARLFFNKSAKHVTLAEAAILAGVIKAPSRLSPIKNRKAADQRAQIVLKAMRSQGLISDKESAMAIKANKSGTPSYWQGSHHYAADYVMNILGELLGNIDKDIVVETSLDLDLQRKAGSVISRTLRDQGRRLNVGEGALISLDGTGAIRAMVGGKEYRQSQYNRAVKAKRQPGSVFKPLVFLAALESGKTSQSIRNDAPVKVGKWKPHNYNEKYQGPISLAGALAKSSNSVAVQLIIEEGPKRVAKLAKRLGIASPLKANASLALGTSETTLLEMTNAYVEFANGGYRVRPWIISRVLDKEGRVLYRKAKRKNKRVIGKRELGMMNTMLWNVVEQGTGKHAKLPGWQVAGKTGTSQGFRDAWFIGYTANLTTGVWFGNDDGKPMNKVTGGSLPADSWGKFMKFAHQSVSPQTLPGVKARSFDIRPDKRPSTFVEEKTVKDKTLGSWDFNSTSSINAQQKRKTISEMLFGKRP